MGLPICKDCKKMMRVGTTSKDHKTQVIYCPKCKKPVVQDTTTKEKVA